MAPIRVLVAEDSLTLRRYLTNVLGSAEDIEVIGEAENGLQAVEMCAKLRPDVVTMDMMMPEMTGLAATEQIMAYSPTPILVVSSSVNRGEAFRTYEALAAGAVDILDKPNADDISEVWERKFLSAVRMVSRIKVITHPRVKIRSGVGSLIAPNPPAVPAPLKVAARPANQIDLIAIGASTGGPGAIADILRGLPVEFPIPVLVVLHISDMFAFAFSDWLQQQVQLPVHMAQDREFLPQRGTPGIIIAPAGRHMVVESGRIRLTSTPERNSCRPSIDELFDSVAREVGRRAEMILLTGMGKDGAAGLLNGFKAGADTIAQNEETSVVFGMPGEAVKLGAAKYVLGLDEIAERLKALGAN